MIKRLLFGLSFIYTTLCFAQVTISPSVFGIDQSITITVDANSTETDCNGFSSPNKIYLHSGVGPDFNPWTNVIGNWGEDDGVGEMTSNGDGTWSITLVPETYYGLSATQATAATKMGMVFRNENGNQEFKDDGCSDFFFNVGLFQLSLTAPTNDVTIISSGATISITATTTAVANFTLIANGTPVNMQNSITSYNFSPTVNETTTFVLEAENGSETLSNSFQVIASPSVTMQAIPSGIKEGINYNTNDNTKVTLALKAPLKDYIYVAGSFNNYSFDDAYLMKQDTNDNELYWLEITGLTANQIYTYQYWLVDETPIGNSPTIVKTADPYSTLVLSPFDDSGISSTSFPNIPTYPSGQEREVTVLQTGQTPYNWVVNNFNKPKKEDLVIYEVLIRDFDSNRNFQNLIDRIDYFKNLNINAIELMPIMEFEGNESWGYNPSFHFAVDKFYGTSNKLKEFIDLCHQNGIAVILDIVLNHAMGRNPLVRMWMNDPDNDGWGGPSTENPFFNQLPTHSFNVGNDFNHSTTYTKNYVKKFIDYWINEFKIDGFRWDLTKGFTQNCGNGTSSGNSGCTNVKQNDRVAVLKEYADYSWSTDSSHYVIFEHLGNDDEEQEWANYKVNETPSKGIMMWGKMTDPYTDLVQGFATDLTRATHQSRGFTKPRLIAYPESHDEERIMYETITSGSPSVKNIATATKRMASLGAIYLTIPGPKMIWHFADLGMDDSIWTCSGGNVQAGNDGCKLATKPQPQWTENWLANSNRKNIYDNWSKLINLKINEDVFEGDYVLETNTKNVRLFIFDTSLPSGQLKNIVILANFNTTNQNIVPNFPFTGTWYNLMENSSISVTNTAEPISIPAGEFRIFGNEQSVLSTESNSLANNKISIYPNPADGFFQINSKTSNVKVFNLLGKEVAHFNGNFTKTKSFNIKNLNSGIYIIKAEAERGVIIERLIKQ